MSFQDIGRRGSSATSPYQGGGRGGDTGAAGGGVSSSTMGSNGVFNRSYNNNTINMSGNSGAAMIQPLEMNGDQSNSEYAAISQAIVQYQQNVGILSNIVQSIGTTKSSYDSQLLSQQYNLQIDVIQQLSSKIQLQLDQLESQKINNNNSNSNNTSNKYQQLQQHRATHLKLTRDYKWVEQKFKNVQLDAKQKWNMVEMEKRRVVEEEQRKSLEYSTEQMQMQLKNDRIIDDIMREREEEIRNINRGMHQVNEIYKDLANIVSFQQNQIDEVEVTMEQANKNAESGLKQIEKAHAKSMQSNCVIS